MTAWAWFISVFLNWLLLNLAAWWWYEKGKRDGFDRGYKKGQADLAKQINNQQLEE